MLAEVGELAHIYSQSCGMSEGDDPKKNRLTQQAGYMQVIQMWHYTVE